MEVFRINIVDTPKKSESDYVREAFLDSHNNCPLCGTNLVFEHEVHKLVYKVNEQAHCPSCNIKIKTNQFGLH